MDNTRPSSRSSIERLSSAGSLSSKSEQAARLHQTPSDQQTGPKPNQAASRKSSRILGMAPTVTSRQQKAAGDSQMATTSGTSVAGCPEASGDSQNITGDPRPRRSDIPTVQEVNGRLNMLKISNKKSETTLQVPQKNPAGGIPRRKLDVADPKSVAGPSRAAGPARRRGTTPKNKDVNAKKLVMTAMEELKSRKGVSLAAIDRNIRAKLGDQANHWRPYIRLFLRKALAAGKIVHAQSGKAAKTGTTRRGLQGCFKLAPNVVVNRRSSKKPTEHPTKKSATKGKTLKVKPIKREVKKKPEKRRRGQPTQKRASLQRKA